MNENVKKWHIRRMIYEGISLIIFIPLLLFRFTYADIIPAAKVISMMAIIAAISSVLFAILDAIFTFLIRKHFKFASIFPCLSFAFIGLSGLFAMMIPFDSNIQPSSWAPLLRIFGVIYMIYGLYHVISYLIVGRNIYNVAASQEDNEKKASDKSKKTKVDDAIEVEVEDKFD